MTGDMTMGICFMELSACLPAYRLFGTLHTPSLVILPMPTCLRFRGKPPPVWQHAWEEEEEERLVSGVVVVGQAGKEAGRQAW